VSELVAPFEIYAAVQLARQTDISTATASRWIKWVLLLVAARAAVDIYTTLTLQSITAPIYGSATDLVPIATIGKFNYVRTFDPVSGLMFAVALLLFISRVERGLSIVTAILTGAVLVLGLTRSEWIAVFFSVLLASFYVGKLGQAIKALAFVGVVLLVIFVL